MRGKEKLGFFKKPSFFVAKQIILPNYLCLKTSQAVSRRPASAPIIMMMMVEAGMVRVMLPERGCFQLFRIDRRIGVATAPTLVRSDALKYL